MSNPIRPLFTESAAAILDTYNALMHGQSAGAPLTNRSSRTSITPKKFSPTARTTTTAKR